jgi:hypothetical protein
MPHKKVGPNSRTYLYSEIPGSWNVATETVNLRVARAGFRCTESPALSARPLPPTRLRATMQRTCRGR